ncbi:MAG: hypothetical protein P8O13_01465, partial [Porticoccaceae bacterium]|nr:hypothetical protein [Porticoccaceae bacterium]
TLRWASLPCCYLWFWEISTRLNSIQDICQVLRNAENDQSSWYFGDIDLKKRHIDLSIIGVLPKTSPIAHPFGARVIGIIENDAQSLCSVPVTD